MPRDDFTAAVARRLAERAGYMCSNPDCNCITVGPSEKAPALVAKKGRGCHICAAASGGPRYDLSQSPSDRRSQANGIWLCANCSDLVDKNGGVDFTADHIRMWKTKHEAMIRSLIRTNASPLVIARSNTQEAQIAQEMVDYLEGKGAFYVHADHEQHDAVIGSLTESRQFLTDLLPAIPIGDRVYASIKAIRDACQDYKNNTSTINSPIEIAANLAMMRKKIGLVLKSLQNQYGVEVGGRLAQIMPAV